ncbi:MAG TPA: hypothetical protein VK208_20665, partial [Pyrinomonadaceae bacterium]|nr:hypothetical protein [Pyrinomonadaceae bacterium]
RSLTPGYHMSPLRGSLTQDIRIELMHRSLSCSGAAQQLVGHERRERVPPAPNKALQLTAR